MTKPLVPEVVSPPHHRATIGLLFVTVCGMTTAAIIASQQGSTPAAALETCQAIPEALVVPALPAPEPAAVATPAPPEPPHPRASELQLAFRAGGTTYVKLASIEGGHDDDAHADGMDSAPTTAVRFIAKPRHGRAKLVGGADPEWMVSAIAPVADADVPVEQRAWKDREVLVDGTCRAKVTGFAVVARLTGEPAYSEDGSDNWTAKSVMEQAPNMLVATLDAKSNCTGRLARDAALPPIVKPWLSKDDALIAAGRAALVASPLGAKVQKDWEEFEAKGTWHDGPEAAAFDAHVVKHPRTNETFVSIHATVPFMCGMAQVNAFGLYRVNADGTLATIVERELDRITEIEQIVDVEGDGTFELIGKPLFDEAAIERADGGLVELLELPFFGCPC